MQGRAMEQPSNPPPGISTGSQSNPAVKISESELMQQEFEDLLDRIPKRARFLLTASCRPADWTNFISLTKLVSEQIDLSNPVGLIYVRDFVVAVIDSIRLAELRGKSSIMSSDRSSVIKSKGACYWNAALTMKSISKLR
jgi:hypothetical protein